jgi:phosphoesterase RecJ-like protein
LKTVHTVDYSWGRALQNLKVISEHHTSYYVNSRWIEYLWLRKGDTEGIVNYGLSIKGNFTAIFIENKDEKIIKYPFVHKDFDVNQFARNHFQGGGHRNAAGGKSEVSMEETVSKFEDLITKLTI